MIVVGGESLIDMVESGSDGKTFGAHPGGSPFNVAMAAGRLGVPVQFLSRLSGDAFGERLERALRESRVDLTLCPRTDQPSTLAIAGVDPSTKGARYVFYTEGTAGVGLEEKELPVALPDEVAAVHVGSFSLTMEPIATALEALVEREASRRVISIDPNIRSMLIYNPEAARERLARLMPLAHILKVSDEDLAWLEPGRSEEEFVRGWIDRGTPLVVVTRGGDGASATTAAGRVTRPAGSVAVADTIGAGDTFMAATLAWLHEQGRLSSDKIGELGTTELEALLAFAGEAAAINCSRVGCDPPWREEVGD